MSKLRLLLFAGVFLAAGAGAVPISSNGTGGGDWTSAATWSPAQVPTGADTVTIVAGDTVVMDAPDGRAGATTINGTLKFSRVMSSTLTLSNGNLVVNAFGTLDMGNQLDPIPPSVRTVLVLALTPSAPACFYGMTVQNRGVFTAHGSPKTPAVNAAQGTTAGQSSILVNDAGMFGWQTGDEISISQTRLNTFSSEVERRTIASLSGGNPLQVNLSAGLTYPHPFISTVPVRVANLTRNVVVRSSGTNTNVNTAYIRNLSRTDGEFKAVLTEFAYIGGVQSALDPVRKDAIVFDAAGARGSLDRCVIRDGFGLHLYDADDNTFTDNIFILPQATWAMILADDSDRNTFSGNDSNAHMFIRYNNVGNTFLSNRIYSYLSGLSLYDGSNGNRVSGNTLSFGNTRNLGIVNASGNVIDNNVLWYMWNLGGGGGANTFRGNLVAFSRSGGLFAGGNGVVASGNTVFSSAGDGIIVNASGALIEGNLFHSNAGAGISVAGSSVAIVGNTVRDNTGVGIAALGGAGARWVAGNTVYRNTGAGVTSAGNGDTFVENVVYQNGGNGFLNTGFGSLWIGGRLGYDAAGTSLPDSLAEVAFNPALPGPQTLVMKGARLHPGGPVTSANFNTEGTFLASYNQDGVPANMIVRGDYARGNGTLALRHGERIYASSATTPRLITGTGHAAALCSVSDENARGQWVSVVYGNGEWEVRGSSSGLLGTFTNALNACTGFPAGNPQFSMTFSPGPSPGEEDTLGFLLMPASQDAGAPKRLLFGPAAPSFNGGKSRLSVAPGAGLEIAGVFGAPAVVDRTSSGDPYYTLVSSGAFSLSHAEIRNADDQGLQLSGTEGVSLSSASFDFMGVSPATCAYITARDLASTASFHNVGFGVSRSTAGAAAAYNVRVLGADASLSWDVTTYRGGLGGESFDHDPNGRVAWGALLESSPPSAVTDLEASPGAAYGSLLLTWTAPGDDGSSGALNPGAFRIFYSTNASAAAAALPSSSQIALSTVAAPGTAHRWEIGSLLLETTYHLRLWTEDESANISAVSNGASTMPFHPAPQAPAAGAVAILNQITVAWTAPAVPPPAYLDHFEVSFSSISAGGPFTFLTSLPAGTLSVPHTGLQPGTLYHYRVAAVDVGGLASPPATTSAMTSDLVPPPGVSTLAASIGGNAGEISLSWSSPGDDGGKPLFTGSLIAVQHTTDSFFLSWSTATAQISLSTGGVNAGDAQSLTIGGLAQGVTHYFRLWTRDASLNWSAISNAASSRPRESGPTASLAPSASALPVIPWGHVFAADFDKPVLPTSVDGAFRVRRVRDNLGNTLDEPVAGQVSKDPFTETYRFTPDDPLAGNSLYEVTVDTGALDLQGNPLGTAANGQFLTAMKRGERNVFSNGSGGGAEFPPLSLLSDGYVLSLPAPTAQAADAAQKLLQSSGDPFRRMAPGSLMELKTFNTLGGPQPSAFAGTVDVHLPYPDANRDGVVDGTNIRAKTLRVHWLDPDRGVWHRMADSSVNAQARTVTVRTPHFTAFALFGQGDTDLSGAHAFPVPHRPGQGPITFTGLGQSTKLRIFSADGELLAELFESDGDSVLQWDLKDGRGAPAPSGVYHYLMTSGDEKKKGSLVIIR